MPTDAILGAAIAFAFAVLTTPVGVSGAVFLVPVQISVLHTPGPAITPTNLLFNLVAIPGALLRFHREGRLGGLGAWLAIAEPRAAVSAPDARLRRRILLLSLAVGTIGGIYGIGGGSILGPILVGLGFTVLEVAPAALMATFLTSAAGILAFLVLGAVGDTDVAPDWTVGIGMGIGGLAGAYLGARLQTRLPEALLRRGLGVLALVLGLRYAVLAIA